MSIDVEDRFGVVTEKEEKMGEELTGSIHIEVFENAPYKVKFEGMVTGAQIDMAWRAMMKEYRVWKHMVFRKLETEKSGGV